MSKKRIIDRFREYHFEFKHLTVVFIVLFSFQLLLSFINKSSISGFLGSTQSWYQKDSAERLANLTTTSLELLLETINPKEKLSEDDIARMKQSFDIILNQQILQHNIDELCIIVMHKGEIYAIDEGSVLLSYFSNNSYTPPTTRFSHENAIRLYKERRDELIKKEQIYTAMDRQTFHTLVPFVLRGEVIGALYMRNTPDFSFITNQIISSFDETSVIYLSLILLGLLAMYFISSYTVKERDEAQKQLFDEHERSLTKQINYEKELLFTKRIYHTHHKAEKVMGFIKDDLRNLTSDNLGEVKYRVSKYSNFVSRVIYDMKWFDPPIQTIRNQLFRTNLNEVIRFIVDHIFLRISNRSDAFTFRLELADDLPIVHVNEFVVWEILEPLMQNSIEHAGVEMIMVTITTRYDQADNVISIIIEDNGKGIAPALLERSKNGIKNLFLENVTSKELDMQNSGYGCYIAYEICKRCGWEIDAENREDAGCRFIITIKK